MLIVHDVTGTQLADALTSLAGLIGEQRLHELVQHAEVERQLRSNISDLQEQASTRNRRCSLLEDQLTDADRNAESQQQHLHANVATAEARAVAFRCSLTWLSASMTQTLYCMRLLHFAPLTSLCCKCL